MTLYFATCQVCPGQPDSDGVCTSCGAVTEFIGKHACLSNFWEEPMAWRWGWKVPTLEHAFQASKTSSIGWQRCIVEAETPALAKKLGRQCPLRGDWDTVKFGVMEELLRRKFTDAATWSQVALLDTGDRMLIEGNTWGDRIWGRCEGQGSNWLGYLLMLIRHELRQMRT